MVIDILKIVGIILIIFFLFTIYFANKMRNPYRLIMIFGKKGSGKTTLLTKLSIKYNKLGWKVFSNVEIFGTYKLDPNDIGFKDFPPNSVLLLDEVSLIWDNRNFKTFKPEVGRYFRLQRHYKNRVYLFSQSFDIDKKIRDLTDEMYLLTNLFGYLSVARKISKTPTLHQPDPESENKNEGFITEDYRFDFPTSWIFTFIPRYLKFFNSYEIEKGESVKRIKYKFANEPYLYKISYFKNYIKDLFKDKKKEAKEKIRSNRLALKVKDEVFEWLENE